MKNLMVLLFALMTAASAQAAKPIAGEIFYTQFGAGGALGSSGPVYGSAYSNPTVNTGNIDNLVFNKPESQVEFNVDFGNCFSGNYVATMQLYDGFGSDEYLVARFWFKDPTDDVGYVLEMFDTEFDPRFGPTWLGGAFPPFAGGQITRSAESWQIRTTRKNIKSVCTGYGDFVVPVEFTLELD